MNNIKLLDCVIEHGFNFSTFLIHTCCQPKGRHSEGPQEIHLICAQKLLQGWDGVGGVEWGWGVSYRGGVRWGGSCRGGVGSCRGGVGHVGVGWVMHGWGGSCRGGVG